MKSIREADIKGKRVLARVDLNVPLRDGVVTDDTRIQAILPNLKLMIEKGARVVLVAHLGRPKGERSEKFSLAPVAKALDALIDTKVDFFDQTVGEAAESRVNELKDGEVLLLENVRFHVEEKKNDPEFSKKLAKLADVYVGDAFGTLHRAHASVVGVTEHLPSYAGLLVEREIQAFEKLVGDKLEHPFVVILGGSKVSDKTPLIENLVSKTDRFLVGGAMAFCFFKAQGKEIGKSKVEEDAVEEAKRLLEAYGDKILLPTDVVVADKLEEGVDFKIIQADEIGPKQAGFDIGPDSIEAFRTELMAAKTILWNGPMGVFEIPPFDAGSRGVGTAVADSEGFSVVGGGDTAAAVNKFDLDDDMGHVSTGGGASLEYMSGKTLPGLKALES